MQEFTELSVCGSILDAPLKHSLISDIVKFFLLIGHWNASKRERPVWPRSRLTTAIHSSRCLEAFHCSSAVSQCWWSITTWANGHHSHFL